MNDKHIIDLLESVPFGHHTDDQRRMMLSHTVDCAGCARAYRAAMVSSSLVKERASVVVEPSAFFQTRVLAAIREQQSEPRGLARVWRAAGALLSTMTASVALLAVLSFVVPSTQSNVEASSLTAYSAEEVILDQAEAREHSDAEVWSALYPAEENER